MKLIIHDFDDLWPILAEYAVRAGAAMLEDPRAKPGMTWGVKRDSYYFSVTRNQDSISVRLSDDPGAAE